MAQEVYIQASLISALSKEEQSMTDATEALRSRLQELAHDGRIACRALLQLAEEMQVSPYTVGKAADDLGLRANKCQLGCFR